MSIYTSVLSELLQAQPQLRPEIYFKPSLTALSHAMEDQVLAGLDQPLVSSWTKLIAQSLQNLLY